MRVRAFRATHVLGGGALGGVRQAGQPLDAGGGAVEVHAVNAHAVGAGEVVQLLLHVRVEVDRHVPRLCAAGGSSGIS